MDSVQARLLDVTRSLARRVDTIEGSDIQATMAEEIKEIFVILGTFPSLRAECQAAAARAEAASAAAAAAPRAQAPPPPAVTNATHAYDIHHSAVFIPEVTVDQFMKQQIAFPHTVHTALPSRGPPSPHPLSQTPNRPQQLLHAAAEGVHGREREVGKGHPQSPGAELSGTGR
ncbi:hypothetical protein CYMTET_9603 [Cymbomonas tetramitiformis]|uniref:Uncharacterized protein n=1 Tax=Cymbomonas tetramitiformis TaxID=36881 RepID=A0AAE0GRC4_9CHLO|nr:hypothetical protein CYMTET_9603 [Cymbomonas tetramitiformis]